MTSPTTFWESLTHGGLLLSPQALTTHFGQPLPPLPAAQRARLERALTPLLSSTQVPTEAISTALDLLFEDLLELDRTRWRKGPQQVDPAYQRRLPSGDLLRPTRLWLGPYGETIPVFVVPRDGKVLGLAGSRRQLASVLAWSRETRLPLVIVTNGKELRLYYIGSDWESFCEWSFERLFEQGEPGPQLDAVRALLGKRALSADAHNEPPLIVRAVRDSRKGHADLSATLGERVRQAVEELVRALGPELTAEVSAGKFQPNDAYLAATRFVMRLVVVFFAEARGLLPVGHPLYADAYGLESLRVQLGRLGADRLRSRHQAWARLLSLFRLVHDGSHHEALPVTAYGGGLFAPGQAAGPQADVDPVTRAIAFFEDPKHAPTDQVVQRLLELIATTKVKIRQGRTNTWITTPVDFAGLETEYIGILYEGLLDYELRKAPDDDVIVFLQTPSMPALPFSRVNGMSQDELKKLFEAFSKADKLETSADGDAEAEGDTAEVDAAEDADADTGEADDAVAPDEDATEVDDADLAPTDATAGDRAASLRLYVQEWAERTVKAANLVKPPRRTNRPTPQAFDAYNDAVARTAKRLYQIVLPGEWYLVRWGGTRKGAGTFYTRPQLAAPTVMRTLRPLAFTSTTTVTSERGVVHESGWVPRAPSDILKIKVCDPACGSGAFLISSLRFLTDALVKSLHHHGRVTVNPDDPNKTRYRLADGAAAESPWDETLPVPPDHPDFDVRLRARLKRHIVEHCIYGVDLDPLAIELARLALWIETLDRDLPFGFLDHKVRAGNSLIGAWLDRFQDYPLAAWERKAGDEDHTRFVHHFRDKPAPASTKAKASASAPPEEAAPAEPSKPKRQGDPWAAALKERRSEVHSELATWLSGDLIRRGSALVPTDVHGRAMKRFLALHRIPINEPDKVKAAYRALRDDPDVKQLERALDAWCSVWFWPGDALDSAPGPSAFAAGTWTEEAEAQVNALAERHRFFHWELAFPDVFNPNKKGFDAIVGNPPWEIQKPNSKEFFSAIDPLYRSYGKQEALDKQTELFTRDAATERAWVAYNADIKARSNWVKHAAFPCGDNPDEPIRIASGRGRSAGTAGLHETWQKRRQNRRGFADPRHAYRHQGSADLNTYKMFLEQAHALLGDGGRLGLIVPSGIYTDKGATDLRRLFLDECRWEWLFSFENREKIFDIHRSFKFCPLIVQKGQKGQKGQKPETPEEPQTLDGPASSAPSHTPTPSPGPSPTTEAIKVAFMRRRLDDWDDAERHVLDYPKSQVEQFSPSSRAILEIQDPRDLEVLTKLYTNGVLLGDQSDRGWGIKYSTEFHMTNDSKLFPPRPKWEEQGYRPDEYGHWLKGAWRPIADFGWQPTHRKDPQYGHWLILDRPKDLVLSRDGTHALNLADLEGVALPLYEGRMISHMDFSAKGWVSGKGRTAVWRELGHEEKQLEPQFLIDQVDARAARDRDDNPKFIEQPRVAFLDVTSATNSRSMVPTFLPPLPQGNTVPALVCDPRRAPLVATVLASFTYDFAARLRLGGTHLNWFVVEETVVPKPVVRGLAAVSLSGLRLGGCAPLFALQWRTASKVDAWRRWWALRDAERVRLLTMLEAIVADSMGLTIADMSWILASTDLANPGDAGAGHPKGFWRIDKGKPPELRHTVLAQVAFQDLQRMGLDAFLAQNDGEGWMLPETLRLSDYGLGHDDRAKEPQPVAKALGPRFYDWQRTQDIDESWAECEAHATLIENLLRAGGAPLPSPSPTPASPTTPASSPSPQTPTPTDSKGQTTFPFAAPLQPDLFGSTPPPRGKRR